MTRHPDIQGLRDRLLQASVRTLYYVMALIGSSFWFTSPVDGGAVSTLVSFFLARCCLGQVPGGAPFSQRSEQATACTNRMQIRN